MIFAACSSDDSNPAESSSNPLNGKWGMEASSIGGGSDYDVLVTMNLKFDGSSVSGTATVNYSATVDGNNISTTINDDVSGSYNDPNINISISDGTSGYTFNYIGSWVTKNENFQGTVKIKFGSQEYTYEEMYLVKE